MISEPHLSYQSLDLTSVRLQLREKLETTREEFAVMNDNVVGR